MLRDKEQAEKIAKGIDDLLGGPNAARCGAGAIIVSQTHRTCQQGIMRAFCDIVRSWAECYDNGRYDDRNAATCKLAKAITELPEFEKGLPYI